MNTTIEQSSTFEVEGNDIVLLRDTFFEKNLKIKGNIYCKKGSHSLTVSGNITANNIIGSDIRADCIKANDINAHDINAFNITTRNIIANNIDANDIDAHDIIANNIDARNIDANDTDTHFIICEKRTKKTPGAKTIAKLLVEHRSSLEVQEQMPMENKK